MTTTTNQVNFAARVWWSQRYLTWTKCIPVILAVRAGRLQLITAEGTAIDAPTSEVSARFTVAQNLHLFAESKKFLIVFNASVLSPEFTTTQRAQLDRLHGEIRDEGIGVEGLDLASQAAGLAGAAPLSDGAELASALLLGKQLYSRMKPWRKVLPAAGVTMRSMF